MQNMKTEINELSGKGFYINFIKIDDNKFDLLDFFDLDPKKYPFLLESVAKGNERARFSILFNKPNIILKKINENSISFLDALDNLWPGLPGERRGQTCDKSCIDVLAPTVVEVTQLIARTVSVHGFSWIQGRHRQRRHLTAAGG